MGVEKATGVDQVTSNYTKGVGVQIMRIGSRAAASHATLRALERSGLKKNLKR